MGYVWLIGLNGSSKPIKTTTPHYFICPITPSEIDHWILSTKDKTHTPFKK